ncbi:MAG: hypothetical protein AVDCRST_MAG37-2433 [uncultured Rubrobacteraceae bacterium]|uniref:Uncharacterized protein n=1 Tax=uncultured Rubrobacteraceae bacterium TaxID=349277 RepID=A0A6J4QTU8_9ACTN|nr:MAG: hypothetical protein AVDCRST_MAG37-2433 [uncultured Rubrobacteraceae bacterium]
MRGSLMLLLSGPMRDLPYPLALERCRSEKLAIAEIIFTQFL